MESNERESVMNYYLSLAAIWLAAIAVSVWVLFFTWVLIVPTA
jgi:hypothetical protein